MVIRTFVKRKPKSKKKSFLRNLITKTLVLFIFSVLFLSATYHYRKGLWNYYMFNSHKNSESIASKHFSDLRNIQLLNKYKDKVAGFDVSEYQGKINWNNVRKIEKTFPLGFVFIRATYGTDKKDKQFDNNWLMAKEYKIIRGAYHYYRPNENSIDQADNFIKTVKLTKGDLPPVLDIESLPANQPEDSLKVGLRRWLEKIDAHYKVRPIIYTSKKYYNKMLKKEFSQYTFWIANYNFFQENIEDDLLFWQFSQKASLPGIQCNVDLNIYNGTPKMLQYMTIN